MAGGSLYNDGDEDAAITDINVTPFVDVVLVLLVVFIVTAKLIVSRGVDIDKPRAAAGADVSAMLRVSVDTAGNLFVNGDEMNDDATAIAKIKELSAQSTSQKALIAGDRKGAYGGVMHAIDVVQHAGLKVVLENERPQ
jgi:biopolymer transport protein ExbD